jgi:hypothetical protein
MYLSNVGVKEKEINNEKEALVENNRQNYT